MYIPKDGLYGRAKKPEDPTRCVCCCKQKGSTYRQSIFGQCNRKRGYGQDGKFCKQHAKMMEGT